MTKREKILVSACLIGEPCRYDGKAFPCQAVQALADAYDLVPVCPEAMGGLPTPRACCEKQPDGRVVDTDGIDRTEAFERGAQMVVETVREHGCTRAILKSKSPSCGVNQVYDGSFSGTVIPGQGLTAAALRRAGIELTDENDF